MNNYTYTFIRYLTLLRGNVPDFTHQFTTFFSFLIINFSILSFRLYIYIQYIIIIIYAFFHNNINNLVIKYFVSMYFNFYYILYIKLTII